MRGNTQETSLTSDNTFQVVVCKYSIYLFAYIGNLLGLVVVTLAHTPPVLILPLEQLNVTGWLQ